MSENTARNSHSNIADFESIPQRTTKKKTGVILGLVPHRKYFLSDESFQQVMDEYIFHCRRLEAIKKLRDCLRRNRG